MLPEMVPALLVAVGTHLAFLGLFCCMPSCIQTAAAVIAKGNMAQVIFGE